MSRFAVGVLLSACGSSSLKVAPDNTPRLVTAYAESKESVILYRGRRYAIRPEQKPWLSVLAWRAGAPQELAAPLGDISVRDDALYFQPGQPIRSCELSRARLTLEGDPPAPLPRWDNQRGGRPYDARRHFVGFQLGGTSYVQGFYRFRIFGPLLVEIGAGALPPFMIFAANGSAGLVLDVPIWRRWSVYGGSGAGAGGMAGVGEGEDGGGLFGSGVAYVYGRLGVATRLGLDWIDQVGLEGGFWRGKDSERHDFLWPMAGVSFVHAL